MRGNLKGKHSTGIAFPGIAVQKSYISSAFSHHLSVRGRIWCKRRKPQVERSFPLDGEKSCLAGSLLSLGYNTSQFKNYEGVWRSTQRFMHCAKQMDRENFSVAFSKKLALSGAQCKNNRLIPDRLRGKHTINSSLLELIATRLMTLTSLKGVVKEMKPIPGGLFYCC